MFEGNIYFKVYKYLCITMYSRVALIFGKTCEKRTFQPEIGLFMQVFLKILTKKDIRQNLKEPDLNLANLFTIHHVNKASAAQTA